MHMLSVRTSLVALALHVPTALLLSLNVAQAQIRPRPSAPAPAQTAPRAQDPLQSACDETLKQAREITKKIAVSIVAPPNPTAGSEVKIRWSNRFRFPSNLALYFVAYGPPASRLGGSGFIGLAAGADGPEGINFGTDTVRAFVPLHRSLKAGQGGEIAVKPFTLGANRIGWAIVAANPCKPTVLNASQQTVEIAPGKATVIVQDRFTSDTPSQIIRSKNGASEIRVFDGRYEVYDVASGALLLARTGTNPNFSPTGRFVVAKGESLFDVVSGTELPKPYDNIVAWTRSDSFMVSGAGGNGLIEFSQPIVDGGVSAGGEIISCRICTASTHSVAQLDINRGYFAAAADHAGWIVDLYDKNILKTNVPLLQANKDVIRRQIEGGIRQRYNPKLTGFPKVWSLGEKLTLSHGDGSPQLEQFVVTHQVIQPDATTLVSAEPGAVVGTDMPGRGIEIARTRNFGMPNPFDALESIDLATTPDNTSSVSYSDEIGAEWNKRLESQLNEIKKNSPQLRNAFDRKREQVDCVPDTDPNDKLFVTPDQYINQIQSWTTPQGKTWLVQSICFAGSARMVNYADLSLIREGRGRNLVQSLSNALQDKPKGQFIETFTDESVAAFPTGNGKLLIASRSGGSTAVIDVESGAREGIIFQIVQPKLLSNLRLTTDGRHLVQMNNDQRFYVYRLVDGVQIFNGVVVDGEAVAITADGLYDSTYEGAHSVQIGFAGMPGQFGFHQFEGVLRRKGLVKTLLAGQPLPPPSRTITSPPRASLMLAAGTAPGSRQAKVNVRSETELAELKLYVDGRVVQTRKLSGKIAEQSFDIGDPGGGRWVSATVTDTNGLVSLPSALRIPQKPTARGTLRAVVVGIDNYDDKALPRLGSAQLDARRIEKALATTKGVRFANTEIVSILDKAATPAAVTAKLREIVGRAGPDDTTVFFFAGHGVDGRTLNPAQGLLLATTQTRATALASTSISWEAIASTVRDAKGTVLVILDACHSGSAGAGSLATNDVLADAMLSRSGSPIVLLASSKGRQVSKEVESGGLFTTALVSALTDRAAVDRNRSGLIDLGELYSALRARVGADSQATQTPWMARNALIGEMSLF